MQAAQARPLWPQVANAVPAWHFPAESQQPPQFAGVHAAGVAAHAPFVQTWPVVQAAQAAAPVPQVPVLAPDWQTPAESQQPWHDASVHFVGSVGQAANSRPSVKAPRNSGTTRRIVMWVLPLLGKFRAPNQKGGHYTSPSLLTSNDSTHSAGQEAAVPIPSIEKPSP